MAYIARARVPFGHGSPNLRKVGHAAPEIPRLVDSPRRSPCARLTGTGQQLWCPHRVRSSSGPNADHVPLVATGQVKIIRAPGGCTNPWQQGATVSIRAHVFPYTASQPAISTRFTLNRIRRCRWFKSPSGHAVCAGQRPTPLFLVPPWLPPQTLKRTDAFPSRQSRCWSPPGPPLVVARWRQRSLQSRG